MNSRERLLAALEHREPDRVPFAFGGPNTGIHIIAYRNLLRYLGKDFSPRVEDIVTQQAYVDEEILKRLFVDIRKVDFKLSSTRKWERQLKEDCKHRYFTDSYGIEWAMPLRSGLYYDARHRPLQRQISKNDIDALSLPAIPTAEEIAPLRAKAQEYRDAGYPVLLDGLGGGMYEHAWWVRGFNEFIIDMARRPKMAERLLDRILAYRMEYWETMLNALDGLVDVVAESDDVAGQDRLILSPKMYRHMLKPRHRKLFDCIRKNAKGRIYIQLHSCGAVRDLIPDFIDLGVDALNPVQVNAANMDTARLKRDFGKDIAFWGGGVDTQFVLPQGTPQQVKDEVKRRIEDLAPGGGFVFATVHNVQADVPPENVMAMWEALRTYGEYHK